MEPDRLTPTLASVLARLHDARQANQHIALPGRVESYDASRQAAIVKPLLLRGTTVEGSRVTEELPVVSEVPVVFPGAGGYRLTFPVAPGDTVLLVCMEGSIDRWAQVGGLVDPGDDRRHDLNDMVAVVGLRDFSHALQDAPTDALSLGFDGGPVIEIDATQVAIGGRDGADFTLLSTNFLSALGKLISAIATAVGGTGGAAITTAKGVFETAASGYVTAIAKVR